MMENGSSNSTIKLYEMPEIAKSKEVESKSNVENTRTFGIHSTILALKDINKKLSKRREISSTISRKDFGVMVNETKIQFNNFEVSRRLDEIFDEYLPLKNDLPTIPTPSSIWKKNEPSLVSSLEQKTNSAINSEIKSLEPQDEGFADGEAKGASKVLRDHNHFKSNGVVDSSRAA